MPYVLPVVLVIAGFLLGLLTLSKVLRSAFAVWLALTGDSGHWALRIGRAILAAVLSSGLWMVGAVGLLVFRIHSEAWAVWLLVGSCVATVCIAAATIRAWQSAKNPPAIAPERPLHSAFLEFMQTQAGTITCALVVVGVPSVVAAILLYYECCFQASFVGFGVLLAMVACAILFAYMSGLVLWLLVSALAAGLPPRKRGT